MDPGVIVRRLARRADVECRVLCQGEVLALCGDASRELAPHVVYIYKSGGRRLRAGCSYAAGAYRLRFLVPQ